MDVVLNLVLFPAQMSPAPFSEEDAAVATRDACDYSHHITLEAARSGRGEFQNPEPMTNSLANQKMAYGSRNRFS